ncbi:MAG: DUF882 domain-containing protein [bacterium]
MRAISGFIILVAAMFAVMAMPPSPLESSVAHNSPFIYTGDGKIKITDTHTGETITILYRDPDGFYRDEALTAIDHTLRCHGGGERFPISLKLVELIDNVQDHFNAESVRVVSGYRSFEYNSALKRRLSRVAHNSLHIQGMAADIAIPGVSKHELAKYARSLATGGVGTYAGSDFVHIDVGPVRTW